MRNRLAAATAALAVILAACSSGATTAPASQAPAASSGASSAPSAAANLTGKTVTVSGAFVDTEAAAFAVAVKPWS